MRIWLSKVGCLSSAVAVKRDVIALPESGLKNGAHVPRSYSETAFEIRCFHSSPGALVPVKVVTTHNATSFVNILFFASLTAQHAQSVCS